MGIDFLIQKWLLCIHIQLSMKLMMYLGNDLIEEVSLNNTKISEPGYLGSFKRTLKQKYWDLIQQVPQQPEFLIINPQPVVRQYANPY